MHLCVYHQPSQPLLKDPFHLLSLCRIEAGPESGIGSEWLERVSDRSKLSHRVYHILQRGRSILINIGYPTSQKPFALFLLKSKLPGLCCSGKGTDWVVIQRERNVGSHCFLYQTFSDTKYVAFAKINGSP